MESRVDFSQLSKLRRDDSRKNGYKHLICILAVWIALFPAFAFALPSDPTVKDGTVVFDTTIPDTLKVIQSTTKAIIDWQTFNIAENEATHFQMPSSNSFNLSRVTGGVGSEIFGTLTSNGNLMLLNPNGILFGANSKIDVGGLVATTSNITNSDFMAGNFKFDIPSSVNRTVINRGLINVAQGGLLAFVAPGVENSGIINAQLGQVSLVSGKTFTLDLYGDKLVSLGIDSKVLDQVIGPDGQPVSSLVKNGGDIFANGGTVFLEVNAARDIVDHVINMDGLIEAKTAVQENGEIILYGGDEGLVNVTGTLDASGKEAGQTGGEVQVLGEWIALLENAFIDVSGDLGGGTALIGGDYQGKGIVPTSDKTYFHSGAFVTADALSSGDGGKVILWADDATYFYGGISAIGGLQSGDGGFAEVSGKRYLDFDGSVDLTAANGEAGTLLLDPLSINILNTTGNPTAFGDGAELFAEDSGAVTIFDPRSGGTFSGVAGGTTIILQATDFITVSDDFNLATATGQTNVSLIMQAGGNINVNADITLDNSANLHIEADSVHSGTVGSGDLTFASGTATTTAGGTVTLIANDFAIAGTINAVGGAVTIGQSQDNQTLSIGFSGANLTDTEIDNITTTGIISIGQATTAGLNGAGGGTQFTSGAITVDELTLGAKNLTLISNNTINDQDDTGAAITTTGNLVLTTTLATGDAIGGANTQGLDIDIGGTVSISSTGTGAVKITEANGLNFGTTGITGALTATATAGDITDTGVLTITGNSDFTAAAGTNITLDSLNTFTGTVDFNSAGTLASITVDDSDGIDLQALSTTGNLTVTAGGGITDSGTITVGGNFSATTDANNGAIDMGTLAVTGTIALNTHNTGNATIDNQGNDINFATSMIGGALNATSSSGGISQTGAITVGTTTTLAAGGANNISLTTSTNNFGTGAFTITSGNDVSITDASTLEIAASNVTNDLTLSAGGALTDSGAVTVGQNLSATTTSGAIDLDTLAVTGTIALNTSGSDNATINNQGNNIDFATSAVGGNLSATTTSTVGQSGALDVNGTTSITATGQNVTLNDATNDFTGAVSVAGANVALVDANAIDLGTSTISGTYDVTATSGGGISQTGGAITVTGGPSNFTATSGQTIILGNTSNAFTGNVNFNGTTLGGVTIANNGAFSLGALTLGSGANLVVTAAGAVTQTGALIVPGTTTITATGFDVTLNNTSNNFGTIGVTGAIVQLVDTDSIILGATTTSGAYTVTTNNAGNITQAASSPIVVSNSATATFALSGTGTTITLDDTSNNFSGTVAFSGGSLANVTVVDTTVLDLAALTLTTLSATGAGLTQSGALVVGGAATLVSTGGSNDITLTNAANNFGGTTSITSGQNATVLDVDAIELGTSNVTGDFALTAAGAVTQAASTTLTVGGTATLAAGTTNDITLNNTNNNFGTVIVSTANDVTLMDSGAIILGAVTTSGGGNLSVTAGGAVTQVGSTVLTVTGATTVSATGNDITLTEANLFTGAVGLTGATVQVTDADAIELGASTISGAYTVIASGGAITQSGALDANSTSTFTASGNTILLTNTGNDFTGAVGTTGTTVTLVDSNAIVLGTSNVTTYSVTATTGNITQAVSTGLTVGAGGSSFTTQANTATITLDSTSNAFTGAVQLTTNDSVGSNNAAALVNGGSTVALDIGASTVDGNLTLLGGHSGGITDSGTITVGTGTTAANVTATATGGAIVLDNLAVTSPGTISVNTSNTDNATVVNATAIDFAASSVNGTLTATATTGNITQSGAITTGTGTSTFTVSGGTTITLNNASNNFGGIVDFAGGSLATVTIVDTTALDLAAISISGNLTATAGGALTDSGTLTIGGNLSATTTSGAILLDTLAVTGTIALNTSGSDNATIDNGANAINFAASSIGGNLDANTTSGGISQSGAVTVGTSASTTLSAGSGNNITLTTATNNFGTGGVTITDGNNVQLTDTDALVITAATVNNDLTLNAGGALTDSGTVTVGGNLAATTTSGAILLDTLAVTTGTIALTTSGSDNATINNQGNAINFATSSIGGSLSATTTSGGISQSGAITVGTAASTTLSAGSGNNITLTTATNNFGTGGVTITDGNDVQLTDTNALDIGTSTVSGNLTLIAGGDITDSGTVTVTTGNLTATTNAGSGAITMGTLAVGGTIALTTDNTGNATINNGGNDINFAASMVTGNLSATSSSGGISQTGALDVNGTSTFEAGSGNNIALTTGTNDFTGAVSITSGNDVSLTDTNAIVLGASTVSGNYVVSAAGDVTNTGDLDITGTTLVNNTAGTANISLNSGGNNFRSQVTLQANGGAGSFGNIVFLDSGAVNLNSSAAADGDLFLENTGADGTIGGTLALTSASGSITQNAALVLDVTGTSSFTTSTTGQTITLGTTTNEFVGDVTLTTTGTGGNATIVAGATNDLVLAASTVNGDLTVTSGNATGISDSGTVTVAGNLSAITNANSGGIALNQLDVTGTIALTTNTGGSATIVNAQEIDFATTNIAGAVLTATASAGNIIQTAGTITVGTTSSFTTSTSGADIVLTNANAFGGAVVLNTSGSTGNASLTNGTTAMVLNTSSVGGDLTLNNTNTITDIGTVTVGGNLSATTTSGAILLDSLAVTTGTIALNTSGSDNATIDNGANAINFAASSIGGNLDANTTSGGISQSGAITVGTTASTTLSAGSGNNITLTTSTNNFGTGGVTITDGNNVQLTDTDALDIAASTVSGNLTLIAGGNITDSGTVTVTTGNLSATTNAGSGAITMGSLAVGGTIALTTDNTGNATIDNGALDIDFATSSVGGDLSATNSANGILQTAGTLTVTGTSTFATGVADDVALGNANNFGTVIVTSANDVTLVDSNAIILGALTLSGGGNLNVTAGGAVTQTGILTVPGTTTVTATGFDVTLTQNNLFTGAVSLTGAIVAVTDADAIDLGATTTTGNFSVTAGSTIDDSGTLVVGGTAIMTATTNILLDQAASDFGTVQLSGVNVAITDTDDIVLGTTTATGTFGVTAGGDITNTGNLTITNATTINNTAGTANISLNSSGNNFMSEVTLQAAGGGGTFGNVAFVDSDTAAGVDLDSSAAANGDLFLDAGTDGAVGGDLSVTSGAGTNITQQLALDVNGTSSFTTSGAGVITLSNTSNDLTGAVSLNTGTGNATLDNGTRALNMGTTTVGGNLNVQSRDAITDSGVITVTGTASFATNLVADKAILLDSQNDIAGAVTLLTSGTGGDVTFDNGARAISFGTLTIGGDLTLLTDAAQTIGSAIALTGAGAALSITVDGGNALNVQAALTTNAGAITLSADDDAIFTAAADLTSGNGNISVTADDDATADAGAGGALTMVDGTVFDAGSGTITGIADEDITLGQMTTTNATTAAITLNTASGNILDGDTNDGNDLTAVSGTVAVTTGGGTFGTTANAIEVNSAVISFTGVPSTVVTPTSGQTLSGTTETVGEASVDQTINIVENLEMVVQQGNQILTGSSSSTVSVGVNPLQPGPGPVNVDVFAEPYTLVSAEGADPQIIPAIGQLNNFWVNEEEEN